MSECEAFYPAENQVLPAENWGTYFLLVVVYVWSLYKSMQVLARDRENEV